MENFMWYLILVCLAGNLHCHEGSLGAVGYDLMIGVRDKEDCIGSGKEIAKHIFEKTNERYGIFCRWPDSFDPPVLDYLPK